MNEVTEIAALLQTTEKNALNRVVRMRLSPVCSRCGGCGNYSFNQVDGTRCFGCAGIGHVIPKERDMPETLRVVREAVEAGALDTYLRQLDAERTCKTVANDVMKAWTATKVATMFHGWASHTLRDHECAGLTEARSANNIMYGAYQAINDATDRLRSLARKDRREYEAQVLVVAGLARQLIADIAAADIDPHPELIAFADEQRARTAEKIARRGF